MDDTRKPTSSAVSALDKGLKCMERKFMEWKSLSSIIGNLNDNNNRNRRQKDSRKYI